MTSSQVPREPRRRLEQWRLFVSEVRNELSRVTWPSWREVRATTAVVIATSIAMGLFLWGIDLLLDRLMLWIVLRFGVA